MTRMSWDADPSPSPSGWGMPQAATIRRRGASSQELAPGVAADKRLATIPRSVRISAKADIPDA